MAELTPGAIHNEDVSQVAAVSKALNIHILEHHRQFAQSGKHNKKVDQSLTDIKKILADWSPYITDGMKKSEAYKYVSNDLKKKGNNFKWWVTFAIVFFSFLGGVYAIIEAIHKIR